MGARADVHQVVALLQRCHTEITLGPFDVCVCVCVCGRLQASDYYVLLMAIAR